MKKLLLLNGSPRGRGSTSLKLAEAFIEGYRASSRAEVRRDRPRGSDIRPCTGCYGCWKSGGACVQKDDMAELLPAYAEADLVLVSTPVYHFGMTAILKAFFERSLPLVYPYMVKKGELYTHPGGRAVTGQALGLFATCGFPDADNFRAMRAHFEKLLGARLALRVLLPRGRAPERAPDARGRGSAARSAQAGGS